METQETVESLIVGKPKRAKSVDRDIVLEGIKFGSESVPRLTAAQVAKHLGMAPLSFNQRLNAIRTNWQLYMVVITVLLGGDLAEVNARTGRKYTQAELDALIVQIKADERWDESLVNNDNVTGTDPVTGKKFAKPFPFPLADGRTGGNGGGRKAKPHGMLNAIFAAMQKVG